MYVDSSKACNDLSFLLGSTASGTTLATRSWSVRVTQLECGSDLLAPSGCTQYYYGSSTGTVQSFNYDGGQHLANQQQSICFRRERGNCRICYTTQAIKDFQISSAGGMASKFVTKSCCGYKGDGMGVERDCVIIPSLSSTKGQTQVFQNICGMGGLGTKSEALDDTKVKTLCSN